ncbi:esterase FE4-like [Galleria mellonella]|uniref:Esterase FE4-like n=1 Tax=Galleria mellonella TaxID=7137 RepID=A0A6J1X035_GALME|nr:esterase FE4-like [Galleria mellonella]
MALFKNPFSLYVIIFFHGVIGISSIDPLVETKVGLIRGQKATDGAYSMFLGIPYATVDSANPFGTSSPYPKFSGVFEAYNDSAICPQIEEFENSIVGDLDCLHLNIYVPNSASSTNRLPVLVWIYGGIFKIGFSGRYLYGPKYLVRHDIILVTVNYRVGPYGFMCLDTPEVPGNQGLKDQLAALRWINDNIEAFAGDTNKITTFGESAGGASVDLLLLYAQEKLFNKVIMQSGTSLCPWVITEPDKEAPLKLANYLGYPTNITDEALQFLATIDTTLVIAATDELELSFKPCVEKKIDGNEILITEHPNNVEPRNFNNITLIIGFNNDELHASYDDTNDNSKIFYTYLTETFNFENEQLIQMEKYVRHFYIGDEEINVNVKSKITDYMSDLYFIYPSFRSLQKYLNNGAVIFHYMFSYNGGRNFVKDKDNITTGNALHADEIGYLFDISYMDDNPTAEDQLVIDRMTTLWANFVKFDDPTPETTDLLPVKWPASTKDILFYLNIDRDIDIKKRPFHERMTFLDLFFDLNRQYLKGYSTNDA